VTLQECDDIRVHFLQTWVVRDLQRKVLPGLQKEWDILRGQLGRAFEAIT
jgi:hypothetical protein